MRSLPPYTEEQVAGFMAACTPEELVVFDFFLASMAKDAEAVTCRVGDLDFERGGVHMRTRVEEQIFRERFVPIATPGMQRLRQHCKGKAASELLFPPSRKNLSRRFDPECKKVAKRAGFPDWRNFTLHRWRRTGAHRLLKSGVPLKELKVQLGLRTMSETLELLGLQRVVTITER